MYCSIDRETKATGDANFTSNFKLQKTKRWEGYCELAIDTPPNPAYPDLFPAAVRGNPLDLEHVWQDAYSLKSIFEARPAHLRLNYYDGLPYWTGLTSLDVEAIGTFAKEVGLLLLRQDCRFLWAGNYWEDAQAELARLPADTKVGPKAAFTQVLIPKNLRVRRPRYDHSHAPGEFVVDPTMPHPPVKVRWPVAGKAGLAEFMVETLLAENIQVWQVEHAGLLLKNYHVLAVATAPWFVLPDRQTSYEGGAIKHVAVALCKLDHWLFA